MALLGVTFHGLGPGKVTMQTKPWSYPVNWLPISRQDKDWGEPESLLERFVYAHTNGNISATTVKGFFFYQGWVVKPPCLKVFSATLADFSIAALLCLFHRFFPLGSPPPRRSNPPNLLKQQWKQRIRSRTLGNKCQSTSNEHVSGLLIYISQTCWGNKRLRSFVNGTTEVQSI